MLRVFHHYVWARKLVLFLAESFGIAVAGTLGAFLVATAMTPAGSSIVWEVVAPRVALVALGLVAALQFSMYVFDLYDFRIAGEDRPRAQRLLRAGGIGLLGVSAGVLLVSLFTATEIPPGALVGAGLGGVLAVVAVRAVLPALVGAPARVLIVGDGVKARALESLISECGEDAFRVVARITPRNGEPVEQLAKSAREYGAQFVVLAADDARIKGLTDSLLRCRLQGLQVHEAIGFCERVLRRMPVGSLRASDLAFADELSISPARALAKRIFDIVVSTVLVTVAAPVLLLVAALIKLDSKGPLFYRQERVGQNGRVFRLWKFRSMRTDAEKDGAVWARANDDRVTRVGRFIRKTRIDEIPQVFNTLLGDMSFVGPRPERPVFVDQLKEQIPFYSLREAVKPGITGWAQIRYPYGASVEDARNKLEYDLYYVKNGSLFLDLSIIFHTVRHVLTARGAR